MKDLSFLKNKLIAHRGIFDNKIVFENTMLAYKNAIKYGYPIEMDVRMLKDGTIVCFHDETLDRLQHIDSNVENMTYEELSFISKYEIPLFEDVLKVINGSVPLLIELKSLTRKKMLETKVAELLDNYDGLFAIQSFNISTLKWFYKNRPKYITGYLVCKKNFKKDYFFKKYDFITINILIYNDKKIKKMRENKTIIGYKITSINEYEKTVNLYDNLICDDILEIKSL